MGILFKRYSNFIPYFFILSVLIVFKLVTVNYFFSNKEIITFFNQFFIRLAFLINDFAFLHSGDGFFWFGSVILYIGSWSHNHPMI